MRQALQGLPFRVLSMADIPGGLPEVVEDGITLLFNAKKKAQSAALATGMLALADDTGLEVEALEGAPGVYSARYAGEKATFDDNNRKLLAELAHLGKPSRKAVFRTVLALVEPPPSKRTDWVEGRVDGLITEQLSGSQGFGYDPVFYLPELGKTFAQLSLEEKNRVSHRGRALKKLKETLARW
jgi:XTP/dITP diphosphohydrolase